MAKFGLKRPFFIDDGQLDASTKQECFVLGYELATIDQLLEGNKHIEQLVHAENRERIIHACIKHNRKHQLQWMKHDPSEGWMMLTVEANQPDV